MSSALALKHDVEQLLFHEAWLLDTNRFDDWLKLFADDGIYWVPSQPQQTDPTETASIVYEDVSLLRMRVERLVHPRAHALAPAPRTLHTIGNVAVTTDSDNNVVARSTLTVVEYRESVQKVYAGRVQHDLNRLNEQLTIQRKRVDLIDCDGVHTVISILL